MRSLVLVFLVCLGHLHFIDEVCGDRTRDKLVHDLMAKYNSLADPGTITLEIGLSLVDLDFDPSLDVLTASVWERYRWTDDRLAWSPSQHGGLTTINLPERILWIPDITLFNPYKGQYSRTSVNAQVNSSGDIFYVPPSVLQVRCSRNQDTQAAGSVITCPIKMGSWTYNGNHVRLITTDNTADVRMYSPNSKYNLKSYAAKITTKIYECCPEPYTDYTVTIQLEPYRTGPAREW